MARTISGHSGALTIAAAAVNGKVLSWKLSVMDKNVETTAAGDDWAERIHINNDWRVEAEWEAADQATWDQQQGLIGTEVAVALKRKSADTNAYFSATGLVSEVSLDEPQDGAVKGTITIECSIGTAPTFDTTPAT